MSKKSFKSRFFAWALLLVLIFSSVTVYADQGGVPTREEIDPQYKWKLEDIYPTDEEWEADYKKLEEMLPDIEAYNGKLGKSYKDLAECLALLSEIYRLDEKIYVYASMRSDENNASDKYLAMADRAGALDTKVSAAVAFIDPQILEISEKTLTSWIEKPELEDYNLYLEELLRTKAHALSEEGENILALAGEITASPEKVYEAFRYVDRDLEEIEDENGEKMTVSPAVYSRLLDNPNRDMRRKGFEAEFSSFTDSINILAATLSGQVKSNIFYAKARNFDSALQASLYPDEIEPEVYNSLIDAVNNNLEPLHRYVSLRKKALGIADKVHFYDMYVPLVAPASSEIAYDDAKKMVVEALQPLGEQYLADLEMGLNSGWIDVYETQNKYSGGYSWGAYDTHPYVLLNYNGSLDSVSTLAHEMGHALNSYYSDKAQPYFKAGYPIFTAEVASTTNEALMLDYLIENAQTKEEKMYLINSYLEQIRGSIYTQLMYAEFEKTIHEAVESGEALSATYLNETWGNLMAKYYGEDFEVDELVKAWWARIPHFYMNFYVYKYATGLASGIILSDKIVNEGEPATEAYLSFLAAGGTDSPIELLKSTGVDLSTTEPVEKALEKFDELLTELETLMNE